MNRVILFGRLTRDPELRATAAGRPVASFAMTTGDVPTVEYHEVVAWDDLGELAGRYLAKGARVLVEGSLRTRTWDDDAGRRHWRTEVVASSVELTGPGRARASLVAPDPDPIP